MLINDWTCFLLVGEGMAVIADTLLLAGLWPLVVLVGIHQLINYRVAPWKVINEHCLVWLLRPILDLQSLLQPWHVKTDAWCGSGWSCCWLPVLLAHLSSLFSQMAAFPLFSPCDTCCFHRVLLSAKASMTWYWCCMLSCLTCICPWSIVGSSLYT